MAIGPGIGVLQACKAVGCYQHYRTHAHINMMINNSRKKSVVNTILRGTVGQARAMSSSGVGNAGLTSCGQTLFVWLLCINYGQHGSDTRLVGVGNYADIMHFITTDEWVADALVFGLHLPLHYSCVSNIISKEKLRISHLWMYKFQPTYVMILNTKCPSQSS